MAEPIYLRVRRVLSASAEEAVDAMERAGGASVLREAIRQVDRALEEVRAEQEAVAARGLEAKKRQSAIRERVADLEEKARFALSRGRDDLAEAALSSQLDLEERVARLDAAQADAAEQAGRLDECAAALAARKAQMEKDLAAFQTSRRDADLGGDCTRRRDQRIKRTVARAEQAFERVMAGTGGDSDAGADPEGAAKLAEIEAMRRSSVLAERLAALRAASSPN